ncbi:MAG: hypothetical protein SFV18_21990 [Bryobacteraceae bacterium]|nr:hypothetical protein [Bryobacteraceae bacterium]
MLADFERALARIVVDPELADRVAADASALDGYILTPRERERLAAIAPQKGLAIGTLFHRSFRISKLAYTLPNTLKALGSERLSTLLHEYWKEYPAVIEYYDREAERFALWLLKREKAGETARLVESELSALREI